MKTARPLLNITAFIAALAFAIPFSSNAAVALYEFGTPVGGRSVASSATDFGVVAGNLLFGPGFPTPTPSTGAPTALQSGISTSVGGPANSLFLRNATNTSEALAITNNKYISFTITPTTPVSLTSLSFNYLVGTISGSISATNYFLRTDAGGDNFNTNMGSGTITNTSPGFAAATSVDLSSASTLQGLTDPTTIRIYFYGGVIGGDLNGNNSVTRLDNLTLNAIPEPSGAALLTVSLLGCLIVRRRRIQRW